MLVPLSQKTFASETVTPVVRSLSDCAFVKGVGLSYVQLYQIAFCSLRRLCGDFGGIEPHSITAPIPPCRE